MSTTTLQSQHIATLKAALEDMENSDPELEAVNGPELTDQDVDDVLERSRAEIEASVRAGEQALERGEYRILTRDNAAAFVQGLMDRGRRTGRS